jgi:ATP-dependent DNA helicase RecG
MGTLTLDTKIEFIKGIGQQRASLLNTELGIFTVADLLQHYPFRYVDKTKFYTISEIHTDTDYYQIRGILRRLETIGEGAKKRLVGTLRDETGYIELIWFQGIQWAKNLQVGVEYIVYGKPVEFNGRFNIPHPEIELTANKNIEEASAMEPVYRTTGKLEGRGLDSKGIRRSILAILARWNELNIPETLPDTLLLELKLPSRNIALLHIHYPKNQDQLRNATRRLKFDELFFIQLRLVQLNKNRKTSLRGFEFPLVGDLFNNFFHHHLPFQLTQAQKKVIKEIRADLANGQQMNRLIQGDVGSGKTIVALMAMLLALDNGFQATLMAPTEILAQQHYISISELLQPLNIPIALLTGSITGKKRKTILDQLLQGHIRIVIGTHALIEDWVQFQKLGLAVVDEQHRFGVQQRASLWKKTTSSPPHIMVMTATPIPRTLAMTLYGDLDVSIIDQLPPGRKPIQTIHRTETHRSRIYQFMRDEITLGRQIYVVYPLIEETEKLDLNNLMTGFETLSTYFPKPQYQISIVHGKMKPADKEYEMQQFKNGITQIMVATTVIEVGVNVPNASVMIIENTERFGLAQLHQLRGRVGRGADQSYCILMSGYKLSQDARARIETMCATNDGFKIAEKDMELRGIGDLEGTQQSGMLNLKIANLATDGNILTTARHIAIRILDADPALKLPQHQSLAIHLQQLTQTKVWGRIS